MIRRYPCQAALLFAAGILFAKGIGRDSILSVKGIGAAAGIAALALAAAWLRRERAWRKRLFWAVIFLFAFGSGLWRMYTATLEMERYLADVYDGQEVSLQGRILKKQFYTDQWAVYLTDSYLETSHGIRPCGSIIVYLDAGYPVIGNTILASGKVALFRTSRNEGNFDECAYYQGQGYTLKVYADPGTYRVADAHADRFRECLYHLQQSLGQIYAEAMPQEEAGAVCAMLLGEKSLLSEETKTLYQQSGIAHLLAISGLHMSILGAAAYKLLRKAGAGYIASSTGAMGLLISFGLMAGMGVSTQRAVVMFGVYLGAACCGRAYDSMNSLAVAALLLFWQTPGALFLAGSQFSFAAVGGVLLGQEACRLLRPRFRMSESVLISWGIQIVTLPVTAWYYFEIPVYSMLLNMLVLPFMGLLLLAGLFGGGLGLLAAGIVAVPFLGQPAGWLCGWLSQGLLSACACLLRYFSGLGQLFLELPGAVCLTGQPGAFRMLGYYGVLLLCIGMLWKQQKKAVLCSIACLALLFCPTPRQAEVSVLDVGQGDGIYIHTSDGLDVFIDGGSSDVSQVGTYRILPFLKAKGVAGIDYWFVSHLDRDHVSGLEEVLESGYPVGNLVLAAGILQDEAYQEFAALARRCQVELCFMEEGEVLRGQKACFTCLAPKTDAVIDDRNARSLVLLYEEEGFSGFFSGDISGAEEQALAAAGRLAPVVFYKAAHHGSNDSNSEEILRLLQPEICAVSCARDNHYGHPGEGAVRRMEDYSRGICYTMESGRIRIRWKDGRVQIENIFP